MSLENQLKGLDITKLKMTNGKTVEQNLRAEAKRLRSCIQKRLNEYMDSYEPKYIRTGGLENSLNIDDYITIKPSPLSLEIFLYFDQNANHKSGDGILGWDGTGETVNTAWLLNFGYTVKKDVWFKNIENFGYRQGGHFIEHGIDDFNKSNKMGIKITPIYPNDNLV